MACSNCPDCGRLVDIDGYTEHYPSLFYCECGNIYDMTEGFGVLSKIPKEEVDLTDLKGYPSNSNFNRGIFIKKTRWKNKSIETK